MGNRPNFLIIGAQKCGTTFLWAALREHPDVHVANEKELRFFSGYMWDNGYGWYESNFEPDNDVLFAGKFNGTTPIGEATPLYCSIPEAITRIWDYNSDMKLIMLLRDPVKRAISHYWWSVRMTSEKLPMLEAFEREHERVTHPEHFAAYKTRGHYCEQLDHIFKHFPVRQVLLMQLNELAQDPMVALCRVTDFIGAPEWEGYSFARYMKQEYAEPDAEVVKYLSDYYAPHNEKLVQHYGVDISGWL